VEWVLNEKKKFGKNGGPVGIHIGLPGLRPAGKPPVCAKIPSWHFCEPNKARFARA
jgi:hypothetical protein